MSSLNAHGLEPQEEAIMDAWDEGRSVEDIAREFGVSVRRVERIVANIAETPVDRWQLRIPTATDRLLAAIARAHPERVAI